MFSPALPELLLKLVRGLGCGVGASAITCGTDLGAGVGAEGDDGGGVVLDGAGVDGSGAGGGADLVISCRRLMVWLSRLGFGAALGANLVGRGC